MKKIILAAIAVFALSALLVVAWALRVLSDLPDVTRLKHYRPASASDVLDRNGSVLTQYYDRKFRIWVPMSTIPEIIVRAVLTAEDDTFFQHEGVNYKAAWEALMHDVQKGRFARGGSTITQQMIKNVLLSREKTISRKLREYVLARKAEQVISKRKILELYLNEVEWGDNIYGIEAASRFYLDKHVFELNAAEAALLAGMLPNPRYYNPYKRPEKARSRQERVLKNMLQGKLIDEETFGASINSPFNLRQQNSGKFDFSALKSAGGRPCCQQALEGMLLGALGDQALYRGGLTIRTSIDKKIQDELNGLEDAVTDNNQHFPPGRISVLKQGNQIMALVCTPGKEAAILDKVESAGFNAAGLFLETISPEEVAPEQIILAVDGEKH